MYSKHEGLCAHGLSIEVQGRYLVRGVNFQLRPGKVGAILGPNGAGKSTLLQLLAGLKQPTTGCVVLDSQKIISERLQNIAKRRALLPQDTSVAFDFLGKEIVELGRYPHCYKPSQFEKEIVKSAMDLTHTTHLANSRMSWLSGGERLRVQLARVLAQIWEPLDGDLSRWLLLDEPTAALDLEHQHKVLNIVRSWAVERNIGVLMVIHDLNLALRYADNVWILDGGQLLAYGPAYDTINQENLEKIWKVKSHTVSHTDGTKQLLTSL